MVQFVTLEYLGLVTVPPLPLAYYTEPLSIQPVIK